MVFDRSRSMVPMVVLILMCMAMLLGAFGALLIDMNKVYIHSISIRLKKWFGKHYKEDLYHREENEFGFHIGELQEFGSSQQGLRLRSGSQSDMPLPRPSHNSHFTPPSKTHKQEVVLTRPTPDERWGAAQAKGGSKSADFSRPTLPYNHPLQQKQQKPLQQYLKRPLPPKPLTKPQQGGGARLLPTNERLSNQQIAFRRSFFTDEEMETSGAGGLQQNSNSPEWVDPWTNVPDEGLEPDEAGLVLDVSLGSQHIPDELPTPQACHGERKSSFQIMGTEGRSSPPILPMVPEAHSRQRDMDTSSFGTSDSDRPPPSQEGLRVSVNLGTPAPQRATQELGKKALLQKSYSDEERKGVTADQFFRQNQSRDQEQALQSKTQGLKHSSPIFGKRKLIKKDRADNVPWALLERSRSEELPVPPAPDSNSEEIHSSPIQGQNPGETAMEMDEKEVTPRGPHEPANPKVPNPEAACHWEIDFNEIQLREVIGGGGFGQVYKAKWRETTVAVKMLLAQAQLDEELVRDFKAEVAILAGLRHPNICLFMGACLTPPHRAIVTELVSRGSLWDALRTTHPRREPIESYQTPPEAWPWSVIQKIAHDTACGMAYLHSNRPAILHRDLKSANLLLDGSYTVKLADFGLARLKAITNSMTGNCGTVQWMAPEVLGNQKYSESADVFSFAIVCWEMLSKVCPYEGMSQIQVAMAVLNHGLRPKIPGWCPDHFRQMIESCWKHDPAERPPFREILQLMES